DRGPGGLRHGPAERLVRDDGDGHAHRPDREPGRRGLPAGLGLRRAGALRLRRTQAALLIRRTVARTGAGCSSCSWPQSTSGAGAWAAASMARSSAAEAAEATTAEACGRPSV